MHKVKKAQAKERLLFFAGVLMVSIISIVFVVRTLTPTLEGNREGQAKVLATYVAISADVLSSVDGGSFQKDFSFKQPLYLYVYEKDGKTYAKVTYDDKGTLAYETPILVSVKPIPMTKITSLCVIKDKNGICIKDGGDCKSC